MRVRIADVMQIACAAYDVTVAELRSPYRGKRITRIRQMAIYLAHTSTGCKLRQLGIAFGYRHHTTIMHAIQKITLDAAAENHDVHILREWLNVAFVKEENENA